MAVDPLRTTIQFVTVKQFLLSIDVPTRKLVLNACIDFINAHPDPNEESEAVKNWFVQFSLITDDKPFWRKQSSKSLALWDAFFNLRTNLCMLGVVKSIQPFMR